MNTSIESHSLGPLLATEVERWQLPAQAAGMELSLLPLPTDLPTIQMDAVRVSQALGNLIGNGLQHTPVGGRVTVHCQVVDDWVEMVVCDTGSGVAAEDIPFLFERFYLSWPKTPSASPASHEDHESEYDGSFVVDKSDGG